MGMAIAGQAGRILDAPLAGTFSARGSFIIRALWLVYVTALYGLAFFGTVTDIPRRLTVCVAAPCPPGQLTLDGLQRLQASGLSLEFYVAFTLVASALVPLVGLPLSTLLVLHRPKERMALMFAFVIGSCAAFTMGGLGALERQAPALWLPLRVVDYIVGAGFPALFFLFPDGRWVPRWTRWLSLGAAIVLLATLVPGVVTRGSQAAGLIGVWSMGSWVLMFGAQVYRYRVTTDQTQRQQIRWIAFGVGLIVLAVSILLVLGAIVPENERGGSLAELAGTAVGGTLIASCLASIGIAVLRYRLFDIDVLINRALVYGALTAFVIGAYGLVVGYLATLFRSDNIIFSLLATALIAIGFQPLRTRLQHAVNRLMYGERQDPYRVIGRLGQRLEAALEPGEVLPTIVQTVSESLKLPYVAIALAQQGKTSILAATGTPGDGTVHIPLIYQGARVGELRVRPRRGEEQLSDADRRLLADLAQQAGVAAHGVALMAELRQLSHAQQRSREQLVLAREEERRRMRRDLHDDLAPTLAGLSLTALTIGDLVEVEPAKAVKLSNDLHLAMRAAVGNIRRLVYDLRPPALDDLGLAAAIRERAAQYSAQGLSVSVEAPDVLPPLPAAVEVAAYRITQEALMNVAKHAQAHSCQIRLWIDGEHDERPALHIEVSDDGVGVPDAHPAGIGLRSISERAAELGGTCVVERRATGGTRLAVTLPVVTESGDA